MKPDGSTRQRPGKRKRLLNIGTWNIQGLATKKKEIIDELLRYDMDIVVLSETKKKGKGSEDMNEFIHIYSGVKKEERARAGVSILVKKSLSKFIVSWNQLNERIVHLCLQLSGRKVDIIGVYAPTDDATVDVKNEFYDNLTAAIQDLNDRHEFLLIGDINSRVGRRIGDSIVGRFGEEVQNDNGERLIELCEEFSLRILNGFFDHRDVHKFTWTQPTRKLRSIIDYIICRQNSILKIQDVRIHRGAECGSDHHLLRAKIHIPYYQGVSINRAHTEKLEQPTYNLASLQQDSVRYLYTERLSAKLQNLIAQRSDYSYGSICKAVHEAAREALGTKSLTCKYRRNEHWWSEQLDELVTSKKNAYERWLQTNDGEDRYTYMLLNREVKREVQKAKNEAWAYKCLEINQRIGGSRSSEAWKVVNSLRKNEEEKSKYNPITMSQWVDYYSKLLTEDRPEFCLDTITINSNEMPDFVPDITPDEVYKAVKDMKAKKSPGPGGLPIELIKSAPPILYDMLAEIFNTYLFGRNTPEEWRQAYVSSIYKKGDKLDCSNYRGISVTNSISKIYSKILKSRIEYQMCDEEEQSGFRAGRSCTDNVFTLKQLVEKRQARNLETHMTFVDLQKAYDSVPLSKLWTCMETRGINRIYIQAIRNIYDNMSSTVKIGTELSKNFKVSKGLRQGCTLAPTLFKLYLSEALKTWSSKCHGMGIPIADDILFTLYFADDQVIVAGDEEDMQYMMRKLDEEYKKWGLQINYAKTEYLVFGGAKRDLNLHGVNIKGAKSFRYLGSIFDTTGRNSQEIISRIGQGRSAIRKLHPLIWNQKTSLRTKHLVYSSLIETITTHGAETWEVSKKQKSKLRAVEMDYWRRSCGLTRLDRIRNEEIKRRAQAEDVDIVGTIERKRLRWYGHLRRMPEHRWPNKLFRWSPTERRKRGRPVKTWYEGVREAMDVRNLEEEDWADKRLWILGCEKRQPP